MSLPITSIVRNANQSWTFVWLAVANTVYYRIVLRGEEIDRVPSPTYTYTQGGYPSYAPPLEIAAGDAKTLTELYPPTLAIQWYNEACLYYDVQSSPDNITYASVTTTPSGEMWVYTYQTDPQPDLTQVYLRLGAVDQYDNESAFEYYTELIVTPPSPPDGQVVISYVQGSHSIQIAAA